MIAKEEIMISLGNRIRKSREQAKFTQEQLAERMELSRATISRWELGEIEPNVEHLAELCRILQVSADYILCLSDSPGRMNIEFTDEDLKGLRKLIHRLSESEE